VSDAEPYFLTRFIVISIKSAPSGDSNLGRAGSPTTDAVGQGITVYLIDAAHQCRGDWRRPRRTK
jgi:hypothetical protein